MAVEQVCFERTSWTEQHIRDAKNADDCPSDELHEVVLDPDEITVEGTPAVRLPALSQTGVAAGGRTDGRRRGAVNGRSTV